MFTLMNATRGGGGGNPEMKEGRTNSATLYHTTYNLPGVRVSSL